MTRPGAETRCHRPAWPTDRNKPIEDLYALALDVTQFTEVAGTTLAFAIRDLSNVDAGTIRATGAALRKLGIAI